MAGNTVLLKHSAQTPLCAERFHEAFDAAGLPAGVFQHLHLSHEAAPEIVGSGEANWWLHRLGRRRARGPGGGVAGASSPPVSSSAARTRPTSGGRRSRPRGREPGRRRLLQLRANAAAGSSGSTFTASCSTRFVDGLCRAARGVRARRPDRSRDHARPIGAGSGSRLRARPGRRGGGAGAQALLDPRTFRVDTRGLRLHGAAGAWSASTHAMRMMTEESFGPASASCRVDATTRRCG